MSGVLPVQLPVSGFSQGSYVGPRHPTAKPDGSLPLPPGLSEADVVPEDAHLKLRGPRRGTLQLAEALEELDPYEPSRVVHANGLQRLGRQGLEAFACFLDSHFGPVEKVVEVRIASKSCPTSSARTAGMGFVILKAEAAAQRVLAMPEHEPVEGIIVTVRPYYKKEKKEQDASSEASPSLTSEQSSTAAAKETPMKISVFKTAQRPKKQASKGTPMKVEISKLEETERRSCEIQRPRLKALNVNAQPYVPLASGFALPLY